MKLAFSRLMLFALFSAGLVHAQTGSGKCAGKQLSGSYAFKQEGTLYLPALTLPNGSNPRIAAVGIAVFEANGRFTIFGVNSFGGYIVPIAPNGIIGTYTMDDSCSGKIAITSPDGPNTIYFVVTDNGNKLYAIYTTPTGKDPGPVVTIELTRQ